MALSTVVLNCIFWYKSKKHYPKIKDCTQIRNKLFTNKYGYSFFSQKLNNLVNENKISDSINQNILNITNLSEDQKKEILNKTQIKISIIHPDNEKSILCRGKITDIELKNMWEFKRACVNKPF